MACPNAPPQTLKILMLHGYTQSGPLFRAKTRFLQTSLKKALPSDAIQLIDPTGPLRTKISDIAFPESFPLLHHPRFKFAVAYSGFFSPSAKYAACYEPKIETPVLHFIGSLDGVVDEAGSLRLVRACVGGEDRVVYHPGGHF